MLLTCLASDTEAVITHPLRLSVLPEFLCAHKAVPEEVLGLPLAVPQQPRPSPLTGLDTLGAHPVIAHYLHAGPGQLVLDPGH